jgi:hypothetical protein
VPDQQKTEESLGTPQDFWSRGQAGRGFFGLYEKINGDTSLLPHLVRELCKSDVSRIIFFKLNSKQPVRLTTGPKTTDKWLIPLRNMVVRVGVRDLTNQGCA